MGDYEVPFIQAALLMPKPALYLKTLVEQYYLVII